MNGIIIRMVLVMSKGAAPKTYPMMIMVLETLKTS